MSRARRTFGHYTDHPRDLEHDLAGHASAEFDRDEQLRGELGPLVEAAPDCVCSCGLYIHSSGEGRPCMACACERYRPALAVVSDAVVGEGRDAA